MKTRSSVICVALLVAAFSSPAWAVPITFAFSGTITRVRDDFGYLDDSVLLGGVFSGYYTFQSEAVDYDPDPYAGYYSLVDSPDSRFTAKFGTYAVSAAMGTIRVVDGKDYYGAGADFMFLGRQTGMGIGITDLSGRMIDGTLLPLSPPSLIGLPSYLREFSLAEVDGYFSLAGSLESLVLVPEPNTITSVLLLVSGALIAHRQILSCRTN